MHPWAAELWMCDLLARYFARLAPKGGDEGKADDGTVAELGGDLKGLKFAVGKGVRSGDDEFSFFDGKKAKGGKKAAKAAPKPKVRRHVCQDLFVVCGLASPAGFCVC